MKAYATIAVLFLAAMGATAMAQSHRLAPTGHAQPYAGQQSRAVSALSPEEMRGFLEGRGMGLAKPAEVNGYPGPMHVLELDRDLALTAEQRHAVAAVFARMQATAQEAGAHYVAAERAVDEAFTSAGTANLDVVTARVAEANRRLGEVRLAHLAAHLEITPLLTTEQRARYAELRGYRSSNQHQKP